MNIQTKGRLGILILMGSLAAILSGCASGYTKGKKSALDLAMPAPGKSKVVFVRESSYFGRNNNICRVHDGDALIGLLGNNSFFQYECGPGAHVFSARMGKAAGYPIKVMEAQLLPDRIYYVKQSVRYLGLSLGVNFYSLHPGDSHNFWPQVPKFLADVEETIVKPEAVADDLKDAPKERKRVEAYRDDPRYHEQILSDHGQARPITSR